MLGKLLKYEIASSARSFLPLYIAIFGLSIFFVCVTSIASAAMLEFYQENIVVSLFLFAFYSLVLALYIVMIIIIVNRFRKALLGSEGYLMFTLPVSLHQHLLSKLITALFWSFISLIVIIISAAIVIMSYPSIREVLSYVFTDEILMSIPYHLGVTPSQLITQYAIFFIIAILYNYLVVYFSLSMGHLAKKSKLLYSIVTYAVINGVLGFILQVIFIVFMLSINIDASYIQENFSVFITISSIGTLLLSAAFYFGTWYILKNKLNLE